MAIGVLDENRRLRFAVLSILYAAQGIPDALVLILFPAYLAAKGASAATIGSFLAIAMLPNSAKLLAGPVIDKIAFPAMGRRRPWIIFGQAAIAASLIYLACIGEPADHITLFAAGAFAITLSTVFQDVATDGMAIDIVPDTEQGRANGLMWGGKTIGTAAAASAGGWLLYRYGFETVVLTAAATIMAVLLFILFLRERADEKLLPWTHGQASPVTLAAQPENWKLVIISLIRALRERGAQHLISISISIGLIAGLTGALLPVLIVQDFGWSDAEYSQARAALKLAAGLAGMIAGGLLIDKLGYRAMLAILFAAMSVANVVMAVLLDRQAGMAFMIAFEGLLVFVFIGFFAATMRQCMRTIAATQFSFTMVCGNIALVVGAALLGPISEGFGYQGVLFAIAIVSATAAMLGARLKLSRPL